MRLLAGILLLLLASGGVASAETPGRARPVARALWVECQGTNDTLSSRVKIDQLLEIAQRSRFNLIYVQLFRGNDAWFETSLTETRPRQAFLQKEKTDMLRYLIDGAHRRGIEVHGWINMLRVVRNPQNDYPVLKRLGTGVVTRNGKGVSMWGMPPESLPDGGYWLEPGDPKVQRFLADLAGDLVKNYPALDGVHLDFIRMTSEGAQNGSMWDGKRGYGCGTASVERFKRATGLDPMAMERNRENCERWDNWRRQQVTAVVKAVRQKVDSIRPGIPFTSAVQCWPDRAYLSSFQDWGGWLEEGIVDGVVTMNYSTDSKLVQQLSRQALALKHNRHVYIGLGPYLYLKDPAKFRAQVEGTLALQPEGIAFFSYDAMLLAPSLFDELSRNFFTSAAAVPAMPWKAKVASIKHQPVIARSPKGDEAISKETR